MSEGGDGDALYEIWNHPWAVPLVVAIATALLGVVSVTLGYIVLGAINVGTAFALGLFVWFACMK